MRDRWPIDAVDRRNKEEDEAVAHGQPCYDDEEGHREYDWRSCQPPWGWTHAYLDELLAVDWDADASTGRPYEPDRPLVSLNLVHASEKYDESEEFFNTKQVCWNVTLTPDENGRFNFRLATLREEYGYGKEFCKESCIVSEARAGGQAAAAGLRRGDKVVEIDGKHLGGREVHQKLDRALRVMREREKNKPLTLRLARRVMRETQKAEGALRARVDVNRHAPTRRELVGDETVEHFQALASQLEAAPNLNFREFPLKC